MTHPSDATARRMKLSLSCSADSQRVRAVAAQAEERGIDQFTMAETAGNPVPPAGPRFDSPMCVVYLTSIWEKPNG